MADWDTKRAKPRKLTRKELYDLNLPVHIPEKVKFPDCTVELSNKTMGKKMLVEFTAAMMIVQRVDREEVNAMKTEIYRKSYFLGRNHILNHIRKWVNVT